MAAPELYHRSLAASVKRKAADMVRDPLTAHEMLGRAFQSLAVIKKPDQQFGKYATPFEKKFSKVYSTHNEMDPVVDGHLTVIGHLGVVSCKDIAIPGRLKDRVADLYRAKLAAVEAEAAAAKAAAEKRRGPPKPAAMKQAPPKTIDAIAEVINDLVKDGVPLFVCCPIPGPEWERILAGEVKAKVLTSIDGQVLTCLESTVTGLADASWIIDMLLVAWGLAKLTVDAIVQKVLLKSLARKEAGAAARSYSGPTNEVAARWSKLAKPDLSKLKKAGEIAPGLKLARGYDTRMGIPEEHLRPMIEAAKDTEVIAVFRANKAAAIPLIRKGAVPKPKALSVEGFKSNAETGVLTAMQEPHVRLAYENGYFVVDADGVARRVVTRAGQTVREELRLTNPYWTVKKGQVVSAEGKPVVGDYDLLGIIPVKSTGSNVVGVPADAAKGDWIGPYVKKYADAVNKNLDQRRVLHGAQDQYGDPVKGGLTDDTAYAVYPDGRVCILEGKTQQQAFYNAYGRKTITEAYPQPAQGPPVHPKIAARRAAVQAAKK